MVRKCRLSLGTYPIDCYSWDIADVLDGADIVTPSELARRLNKRKEEKKKQRKSKKRVVRTSDDVPQTPTKAITFGQKL